ncbi:S41 family peptidase [Bacillus benzoevorans]|uniref:C-terminal processing peptidase n=1 Tax=Bacillus benzoevorans TaxID=1456 RepID=A0A7X0LUM7_9BACI|nr:S41 family peptidase [Bacillus benzoevorans]MBB6445121.1 carboxyl-terminal processing protease [Bacillus benzoevorans]
MKQRWIALLMIGSLLTGAGGTYAAITWLDGDAPAAVELKSETEAVADDAAQEAIVQDVETMDKFVQAYQLIKGSYVEEVKDEQLIEGAIQGMITSLKDPYSVYMNKEISKQFNEALEPSFEGIGAEVSMVDGKIVIVAPFKNSPAEKAGVKPNDQILKVNGESVEGLDLYEATVKIRGKKGTTVKLELLRQGLKEPIVIAVKRDEIPQITVHSKVRKQGDKSIGYIEVTTFSKETAADFSKQLKELEKKKIDGLIIDVRGNPGGLLESVQDILKEFVSKEKPYVQIEKRNGERDKFYTTLEEEKAYPVAVLIDKGSASASEILAGALSEAEGYTLIGEKTFGKGTVQQAKPMGDGSNIKLTLYKWLTPDGNWIHNKGIKPDLEVQQSRLFQLHPVQMTEPLAKDMNSEQVKNVQSILTNIGYEPGRTDGYFDNGTETAVKAFQMENNLPANGRVDEKTAKALEQKVIDEQKKEKNDLQLQAAYKFIEKIE